MTRRILLSVLTFAVFPLLAFAIERKPVSVDIKYDDGSTATIVAATQPATQPTPPTPLPPAMVFDEPPTLLGINLSSINSISREECFVDVMRYARHWGTTTKPYADNSAIPTTPDGWPTTDFGARMITDRPNMAGMYRLKFTGPTTVSLKAWGAGLKNYASTMLPGDSGLASYTADVTIAPSTQPANLDLAFVGTAGKVRDVQLLRSGVETSADGIFTRDFVERMQRFGVIRFMDWLGTNGSKITTWESGRVLPGDSRVDVETCVALANAAHRAPWLCIPYHASDDYVRKFGETVRAKLDPKLPCYVEFSNEVWNYIFEQGNANLADTRAAIAAGETFGSTDLNAQRFAHIAKRAVEISKILGTDGRFRVVLASQLGWSPPAWVPKMQLDYVAKTFGPPKNFFYALAQAPYLDLGKDAAGISVGTKTDLTPEIVIATLAKRAAACGGGDYQRAFHTLAATYGLKSFAYEGGVDVTGGQSSAAKIAAQRDPRIGPAVEDYLMAWNTAGGGIFNYFADASKYDVNGVWGLSEDSRDNASPKAQAAFRVAERLSTTRPAAR
jgi:hypothetical protein